MNESSATWWDFVTQAKQGLYQDNDLDGRVKSNSSSAANSRTGKVKWITVVRQWLVAKFMPAVFRFFIVLAYLGLALSGTYAAVINLGLLHLPFFVYASLVCLIGCASFLSNLVDWLREIYSQNHFSTEKMRRIERRLLLSPKLSHIKEFKGRDLEALEELSDYLFMESQVRKKVERSLVCDKQVYGTEFSNFPIELKARALMADNDRESSDHREEMLGSSERLTQCYIDLQELINNRDGFEFMWRVTASIGEKPNTELSEHMVNQVLLKTWPGRGASQQSEIDPDRVAAVMTLRFIFFARRYSHQLQKQSSSWLSEEELKDALKWSLDKYLSKRAKKERNLKHSTREIGILANVLVWVTMLVTNTLTVVASAPIKLISNLLGMNVEGLLCAWFYLSGLLIGTSVGSAKKFLGRVYRFIQESSEADFMRLIEDKGFRFRLFLVTATAISSCYFSMFSIMRLLANPSQKGAEYMINFLSKWLIPQVWPIIMPIWIVCTLFSAIMSLYKDSKFYSLWFQENTRREIAKFFLRQKSRGKNKRGILRKLRSFCTIKNLKRCILVGMILTTSLAVSLCYHVTVMKLTGSIAYSLVLSSCVFLMNYAKLIALYQKIKALMKWSSPENKIVNKYRWHIRTAESGHYARSRNNEGDPQQKRIEETSAWLMAERKKKGRSGSV